MVVPVYNEAATLDRALDRILARPEVDQLVLVDDGSQDGSREILARRAASPKVLVLEHDRNRGKGAALRTGFAAATCDLVLVQDADLEYDPADYPKLLAPFEEDGADVVYGSRFLVGREPRLHPLGHYLANRFLTFLSNVATGLDLTDMETCYKVFRREVLQGFTLRSDGFAIEPEITAKVARLRVKVHEVPVTYDARSYDEGKKITWRDGIRAVGAIVRFAWRD